MLQGLATRDIRSEIPQCQRLFADSLHHLCGRDHDVWVAGPVLVGSTCQHHWAGTALGLAGFRHLCHCIGASWTQSAWWRIC